MKTQLEQATVLVLDDDKFVVSAISGILKRIGAGRVVQANDVDTALRLIGEQEGGVDAALVDFQMPERHGLQFIKHIRTGGSSVTHDMPCLMLTNHVHPRLLGIAMALDVDAFLEKPAKPEELKKHLLRSLSNQHKKADSRDYAKIEVEQSLEALVSDIAKHQNGEREPEPDGQIVDLSGGNIPIGKTLTADLVNGEGQVLLAAGTVIDASIAALLENLMNFDPSIRTIRV